ncbi:DUF3786 domain-containing protein [Desulfatiferula olefinivorans]
MTMPDNYAKLAKDNHARLMAAPPPDLAERILAREENGGFVFQAFGEACRIDPTGIYLDNTPQTGVVGILLSMYALHADPAPCVMEPLKAYKEFPGTMPYVGAFATHTEQILLPYVKAIRDHIPIITQTLDGLVPSPAPGGDFCFVVKPLPKIALCYIFYEDDEDFPASVTCLYSNNASRFIPNDALADVGEYTSKKIISLVESGMAK